MKIDRNWVTAAILTLPCNWVIAFFFFMRPYILSNPIFIFLLTIGLLIGLSVGGLVADKLRGRNLIFGLVETMILVIGIIQWSLPSDIWLTSFGLLLFCLILFLFGAALALLTVFLNQLVSSIHRGRLVGILTALSLAFVGLFSFVWSFPTPSSFAPAITAGILLLLLVITFIIQTWKGELQTYMVPGSIRPYAIWWIIYLTAFGLYVWATPLERRFLLPILNLSGPITILILLGLGGAIFVLTFLPDKLGRKLGFNIGTLLLGLLCIFGPAQFTPIIGLPVSIVLSIVEAFVIAFIFGIGVWLVWAEVGSVGLKGRRVAFGWGMVALLGALLWAIIITPSVSLIPLLVYPIAASLVLISIFPLTNAREVVWNERIVEDIDVSVDSRQVSRALRDLEVDTSLRSIEEQIEAEIAQLTKIKGLTKKQAKELRDAGYETPELVARANRESLAQMLSISLENAEQIIKNAKTVSLQTMRPRAKSSRKRKTK